MDDLVPRWVRIGLGVALAPAQLLTGLWAVVATRSWFDDFPGLGPALVAAEPPFNAHLASDAGGGFLATGVALAAAAVLARRSAVYVALLAYLSLALPHLAYHAANPAAGLSGTAQAVNLAMLSSGVAMAMLLGWGTWSSAGARDRARTRTPTPSRGSERHTAAPSRPGDRGAT